MKRKQTVVINGVEFELVGNTELKIDYPHIRTYGTTDIFAAYKKPSHWKVDIWNDWCAWADAINDTDGSYCNMCISGVTSNFFSIYGLIEYVDLETGALETYTFWITAKHNRLYKVI